MVRCLVVEDETLTRQALCTLMQNDGIDAVAASDSFAGAAAMREGHFDIAIVDLGLPGPRGDQLVRDLAAREDISIIVLTADGEPDRRIALLDAGADDYVVKPYHPGELLARIRAVLRRRQACQGRIVRAAGWLIDLGACEARPDPPAGDDAAPVALTRGEAAILQVLADADGKVVSRERLSRSAARPHSDGDSRTVDTLVFRLRRKLARDGASAEAIIATAPGFGYRLVAVAPGSA